MKTELEKCLAGELFNGADPELVAMCTRTKRLLSKLNAVDYADNKKKYEILTEVFPINLMSFQKLKLYF